MRQSPSAPADAAAVLAATFRQALDRRDADLLGTLFHEDCEHVHVNRNAPPARPIVVRGRAAVAAIWKDDLARDIAHRVDRCLGVDDGIAMQITCRHPDGTQVATMMMADLRDGLIHRCQAIECWDE